MQTHVRTVVVAAELTYMSLGHLGRQGRNHTKCHKGLYPTKEDLSTAEDFIYFLAWA